MAVEPLLSTRPQRAFIATISIQAIVVLAMVAITFRKVSENVNFSEPRYKTLPCYLALFALAEIFEFLMALDALRLRNTMQLAGILLFHVALIVCASLQVHETRTALVTLKGCDAQSNYVSCDGRGTLWRQVEPFLIVAPCVIAASWFALFIWIRQLYGEFGWAIFHVVGANPKMRNMYWWYQIMICLLKFDFFCFSGVTVQLLIVVLQRESAEFAVTIAAIPVVLFLLAACGLAVAHEVKWLMTASLVTMLAALSYLFKLIRFYSPATESRYITTRATLTMFTIVAFVLLFATFAVGLRCFSDFDKGLRASKTHDVRSRPKLSGRADPNDKIEQGDPSDKNEQRQASYTGGSGLGARISIE